MRAPSMQRRHSSLLLKLLLVAALAVVSLGATDSDTRFNGLGHKLMCTCGCGQVLLECNQRQACRFAGRFLSMKPSDTVDDVVRDVLGELANMIGGNMKCGMTPGVRLSMPTVLDGSDYDLRVCGSQVSERLAFRCEDSHFWVTVLSKGIDTVDC